MATDTSAVLRKPAWHKLLKLLGPRALAFHSLRLSLATTSRLWPEMGVQWAMQLFATPMPALRRHAYQPIPAALAWDREITWQIQPHQPHPHHGKTVHGYIWGDPQQQPTVLLVHGWSGYALQLREFVTPLRAAGYAVVAVDMPAHGRSSGRRAHFFSWHQALVEMAAQLPRLDTIIGHSLGGATLGYALSQGLQVPRAVMIAAPADLLAELHKFSQFLWLPRGFGQRIAQGWTRRLGRDVSAVNPEQGAIPGRVKGLLVHDKQDRHVAISDMYRYQRVWPGCKTMVTDGLGHTRILQDRPTVERIVTWLTQA
ncbi:alpha/beta hydrolase [Parvibium lacunae]|nr:alpha/beta fold hydrolase [Parvibium lacunae]